MKGTILAFKQVKVFHRAMRWIIQEPRFRFTTLLDAFQRPVDHCPISLEPMEDPVLVCDGHVYDKTSITTWLSEGNKPLSRLGPLLKAKVCPGPLGR